MKILQIIHDFLPRHMAGSEIYTYNLSRELARSNEVELFFTEHRPGKEQYSVGRGSYRGLNYTEAVFNHIIDDFEESYLNPAMDEIFTGVLDRFEPDVIHVQHLIYHSLNYLKIAHSRGIPVVYTLHDYWLTCPDMRGGIRFTENMEVCHQTPPSRCAACVHPRLHPPDEFQHKMYLLNRRLSPSFISERKWFKKTGRWLLSKFDTPREGGDDGLARQIEDRARTVRDYFKYVDLFIAPSPFLRKEYIAFGIPPDRIVFSDYGFDKEPFEDIEREHSPRIRFAFIGTPSPHKGLHVLIEAFNKLKNTQDAELNIYGDLEIFAEYGKQVKKMARAKNIRFKGRFDNSSLAEIYRNIDVLVVPSLWFENSPLTIHEAFMAGIPVITSDFGGMKDLVDDGRDGFLFRRGDEEHLRETLNRFIKNPDLLERLRPSPDKVKNIGRDASEIMDYYRKALNLK